MVRSVSKYGSVKVKYLAKRDLNPNFVGGKSDVSDRRDRRDMDREVVTAEMTEEVAVEIEEVVAEAVEEVAVEVAEVEEIEEADELISHELRAVMQ